MNEEDFVQHLAKNFLAKPPILGIGDDCAVIPIDQEMAWVVTTDALVEGVHFLKDQISPKDLGYKSIAVSVSDVVAMGGFPKYAFLTMALPKTVANNWLNDVIEGIKDACREWDLLLLGGDTVGSKRDIFLNTTVMGTAQLSKVKYRNKAKSGDRICVNGFLGDSAGGLKALREEVIKTSEIEYLLHCHFHPKIHLKQGLWLASQKEVHAMMDLSDGLDCDLKRLIKSSQKGAIIETSKIPISVPLSKTSLDNGWDALMLALSGGEDYSLLFTISSDAFDHIHQLFQETFKTPIYDIGRITDSSSELIYQKKGKKIQINPRTFNHFQ